MILATVLGLAVAAQSDVRPLTPTERATIENSVKEQLNDPDSADFRHNAYRVGSSIYCGRVNAKNRVGGYIGFQTFKVNVKGGKNGAMPEDGEYGEPSILNTADQFDGNEMKRLLFSATEARCSKEGYVTGQSR